MIQSTLQVKEITLIFPNQLFENHPALAPSRPVFLVEEFLFFRVQPFHAQKLVLLRAAMKAYEDFLKKAGYTVHYIDSKHALSRGQLFTHLATYGLKQIHMTQLTDDWLEQDLQKAIEEFGWKPIFYDSPMFLCTEPEIRAFFKGKKKYSMAQFYAYQRKKHDILMLDGAPVGGKFSFDKENRKRIPKNLPLPPLYTPPINPFVSEAIAYVTKEFPSAIGQPEPFCYPTTFSTAKAALADFLQHKLALFGDYEDAIKENESFLFHSVLSPLLNIGLLTPQQVLDALSDYLDAPLNSLEGFIRQIIGWREFMRACYLLRGRSERTTNYFKHTKAIPRGFWDATTGIEPIDSTIKRVLKTGYCHHIERLMVLGNFLLLAECSPDAIYEWFMAFFVDAYDWVMVPNIYAMSQYADGGQITTKPYISGANYILKMSDYKKGPWVDIWDGLFWRFMDKHQDLFKSNPRTAVLLGHLETNATAIYAKIAFSEKWLSHTSVSPI